MCPIIFRLSNMGDRQETDMVAVYSYLSGNVAPSLGRGSISQLPQCSLVGATAAFMGGIYVGLISISTHETWVICNRPIYMGGLPMDGC
jgi:hypothetical protein